MVRRKRDWGDGIIWGLCLGWLAGIIVGRWVL